MLRMRRYSTNPEVEAANEKRLKDMEGPPYKFEAVDHGERFLLDKIAADQTLTLRKGAQVCYSHVILFLFCYIHILKVMLLKNKSAELVNGSIGIVVDFIPASTSDGVVPVVEFTLANGGKIPYQAMRERFDRKYGPWSASREQVRIKDRLF